MKNDNLYKGNEAREKIMAGVKKVSEAVAYTMGTSGKNSVIETIQHPFTSTTNDGATIVEAIKLTDPLEDMGRKILREAVSRANRASGDGSSTTCVLTSAILEEGIKHLGEASVMDIKRSLEGCIPLIEESLKSQRKMIGVDEVKAVATISSEDEKMGEMIQEIYQKIGKSGVITWDVSKTTDDHYEIGSGITVNGMTCPVPFMYDRDANTGYYTNSIRRKNPKIILTKQKVSSIHELNRLGEELSGEEVKEVVIICPEVDRQAIEEAAGVWQMFKPIFVKMPVLWADEWWEDLAEATGAIVIGEAGIKLSKAGKAHAGTCERITIGREDTVFEGIKDLSKHILALQVGNTDAELLRASRLNVKTARYYVGGYSDQAIYHRRLKLEDAINSAHCALENGILPGGGVALRDITIINDVGGNILTKAIREPYITICANAGIVPESYDIGWGIDTKNGQSVSMFEAGIVDAYDVVLNGVKAAIGVAASILTLGSVVLLPREEEKENAMGFPVMK